MKKNIIYSIICLVFTPAGTLLGMQQQTSVLIQSIKNGDKATFNKLMNEKIDINEKDAKGATALHYAANHLDKDMIIALLNAGAKINTQDNEGRTPLHYATNSGYIATIGFETLEPILDLLMQHGANISLRDKNNKTPVFRSAERVAIQEYLRAKRTPPTANDLALFEAIKKNNVQEAEQLINIQKVNPNAWRKFGPLGTLTPLRAAIGYANLAMVEMLIAAGADIHERDEYDNTPLYHAAGSNNPAIVRALIEAGADVNAQSGDQDYETTPLFAAIERENPVVVELLLNAGARTNIENAQGLTPLKVAKNNGNAHIITLLEDIEKNPTKQKLQKPVQKQNALVTELQNLEQTLKQLASVL